MTVRSSNSTLMRKLERVLDDHEDYITVKAWEALEKCFDELDDEAVVLQEELVEANERIKELEEQLENEQ
ncbi:hypothetical protein [Paenibacillus sp. FSL L8-0709]|uniref:hypothetical protein n=1 Tax=Paenibacillus sp. FSL L8-0709 TaxID=2975312 RepID=UPI0030F71B97